MNSYVVLLSRQAHSTQESAENAIVSAGATILETLNFGFSFKIQATEEQLAQIDGLASHSLLDQQKTVTMQLNKDHLKLAVDPTGSQDYNPAYNGQDVDVFLLDTGIRSSHVEFSGANITDFYSVFGEDINEPDYEDTHGHGTAVASMIVGQNQGAAPGAHLHNIKLFNTTTGQVSLGLLLDAFDAVMQYHINNPGKPKVVCAAWTTDYEETLNLVVEYMTQQGIIFVCAAGNGSTDIDTVSPASVRTAITVGSFNRNLEVSQVTNTPWQDGAPQSGFVNYGSALDVFALGVDIETAGIADDNIYIMGGGTSMSAGIVAGLIAQYVQRYPDFSSFKIKETFLTEGHYWGRNYLVFDESDPNIDYSLVYRSIASTENLSAPVLASTPSGRLLNIKIGETMVTSLGLNPNATDLQILDFAQVPAWISIDFNNDVVTVDASSLPENFPGTGFYLFAIKGTVNSEMIVEEYGVGVYENSMDELATQNTGSYYYDADSDQYDFVNTQFTLGKFEF